MAVIVIRAVGVVREAVRALGVWIFLSASDLSVTAALDAPFAA